MGYTIYWHREKLIDKDIFKRSLKDFKKIHLELKQNGIILAGPDGEGQPMINEYGVSFNGSCESSGCCEPFTFVQEMIFPYREPTKENGKYFQFTKTEGLPYGLAVMIFLIIAKHYLNEKIIINSDDDSSWDGPKEVCQEILGYGEEFLPESVSKE
jgi:hypothetical protein